MPIELDVHHLEQSNGRWRAMITQGNTRHRSPWGTFEEAKGYRDALLSKLASPVQCDGWTVQGVTAGESEDWQAIYDRAVEEHRKWTTTALRKETQRLTYDEPIITIVASADHHLGNPGTDVERLMDEARLVAETPNTYAMILGDIYDLYILQKMQHLNFNHSQTIKDQIALGRMFLQIVGPKLALWVGGNHDGWIQDVTGLDYVREKVAEYAPRALYDTDDCRVVIDVCGQEWPVRCRHKWRGNSIYNPTHAIERAQKWDQDFLVGIGGHTHAAAVAREFNCGGQNGLAVMLGTYKVLDTYARELGVPKANRGTAVAITFDAEAGSVTGTTDLEAAAKFMRHVS